MRLEYYNIAEKIDPVAENARLHAHALHTTNYTEPDWVRLPTEEPLSSETKEAVREDLKRQFSVIREAGFQETIEPGWKYNGFCLKDPITAPQLLAGTFEDFCNKPTTLYWLAAANYEIRTGVPSACIYKQWFHCHDLEPNFNFGHYFACPIRVTPTGPASVSNLLQIHASIWSQAALRHAQLSRGELARVDKARCMVWPEPKNYTPTPLCRAIITVLDRFDNEDEFANIKDQIHRQTLLLILTGDSSGLSAPISFDSIATECLPLESNELQVDNDARMVRVTVGTAVKFITDIEKRELAAYPETQNHSIDSRHCPRRYVDDINSATNDPGEAVLTADEYADMIMRRAEKVGIDGDRKSYESVRRVEAAQKGDVWPQPDRDPWLGRTADGPHMGPWD